MNEKGISLAQLRQRKTRQTAALFLAPVSHFISSIYRVSDH